VGRPEVRGREGPDQHADRADAGGLRGTAVPKPHSGSVAAIRAAVREDLLVVEDDLPLRPVAERLDLLEARDLDDLGGDPFRRRRIAHAERHHDHRVLGGSEDFSVLHAADPVRHHNLLGPDAVDAVPPHLFLGPADRLLEVLRSGQSRADAIGQVGELPISTVAGETGGDEPLHRVVAGGRAAARREGGSKKEGRKEQAPHRGAGC